SKVVLGKSGFIKGSLNCQDADIEGRFNGNLNVSGILSLRATANIEGEVIAGKLAVEPGAMFNASCKMKSGSSSTTETKTDDKTSPYDRSQRLKKASNPLK
ncbi:MAG: polymer-forming cytoskeletal protein, partial [Flavobacteriaceae bacterium]|nr:polymer-forming cytoskeletal protein [Flavobacteriaceae bacterium]